MWFTLYRGGWLCVIGYIEIQENQFLWSHCHTSFSVKWDLWSKIMLCWMLCQQMVLMFSGTYDRTITVGSAWSQSWMYHLTFRLIKSKKNIIPNWQFRMHNHLIFHYYLIKLFLELSGIPYVFFSRVYLSTAEVMIMLLQNSEICSRLIPNSPE